MTCKIARWRNHRHFDIRCARTNILPNNIALKTSVKGLTVREITRIASKKLLNVRISQETFTITKLEEEKRSIEEGLFNGLDQRTATEVRDFINRKSDYAFSVNKKRQCAKYEKLLTKHRNTQETKDDIDKERWVLNISKRPLNEAEKSILQRGLNYAITPKKIPISEIITATELACSTLSDTNQASRLRNDVTKALEQAKPPKTNISKEERQAITSLKKDDSIQIIGADKGRLTVIMDKKDYEEKANALLNDTNTYEKLKKDPTKQFKSKLTNILGRLKSEKKIDTKLWQKLYPTSENPPRFYGLPKVHKTNYPLRPIVSSIGTITYETARLLADLLSPLVGNTEHHIINSMEFADKLKKVSVTPGNRMVSFDVSALFTSIPVPDALDITRRHLEADTSWQKNTLLNIDDIMDLLKVCLETTYFVYKGLYYKQIQGTAMGSPVSPIIANIYMEHFEQLALESYQNPPKIWYRYVDDTFAVIHEYEIDDFTLHLNCIDPNIKFTREVEENGQLPFLDTIIHLKEDGSLRTTIYRKPTHTDQYLNFESHHHIEHKRSVVRTLLHRAEHIVSDEDDKKREIRHVKKALKANLYKPWIFDIPKRKETNNNDKITNKQTQRKVNIGIPYTHGLSEQLQRLFKKYNINIYHKPMNQLGKILVHPKDKIETIQKAGVVYQLTCQDCQETYIGETGRPLKTRIDEHRKLPNSALHEHQDNTGHKINWQSLRILDTEQHQYKRKIKEALYIRYLQPALNRDTGTHISHLYDHLLSHGLAPTM